MSESENVSEKLQLAIDVLEQEKKLLGYELHDNLMGLLVGTKLNLESIKLDDIAASKERLRECIGYIGQAIEQTRSLISDLSPQQIKHSLRSELQRLLERYSLNHRVEFEFDSTVEEFDLQIKTNLYRMAQECLNNIQRHAQASEISIRILALDNLVVFLVADNGVGFEVESTEKGLDSSGPSGVGLSSIQERARAFEGSACFFSSKKDEESESLSSQLAQALADNLGSDDTVQSLTSELCNSCPHSGTAILALLSANA